MHITDNDIVAVRSATRNGATNIRVEVQWTDGVTNEDKGVYSISFADADEFKAFLEMQTFEEMMRAVLLQVYNRSTGALRGGVFDALPGKSFRVQQRVQQI